MLKFDYIVVGSGLAGLYAAYKASMKGSVAVITKSFLRESNSFNAQGGIAAVTSEDDDPEMGIWLSNGFTRGFQETVDTNPDIILRDLYYKLARNTVGSHATVYNVENYGNMYKESMNEYF